MKLLWILTSVFSVLLCGHAQDNISELALQFPIVVRPMGEPPFYGTSNVSYFHWLSPDYLKIQKLSARLNELYYGEHLKIDNAFYFSLH
jgi:hypothetical protein